MPASKASEVLDSRGSPTVAVEVTLADGTVGQAMVPSGASTGINEAIELRDGDKKRFGGKGVLKAVEHVNTDIARALKGVDAERPARDRPRADCAGRHAEQGQARRQCHPRCLAGVRPRGRNGAWRAPLPLPGRRRCPCSAGADVQHLERRQTRARIPPTSRSSCWCRPACRRFREAVRCGAEVYAALRSVLHDRNASTNVGDEGGFAPSLPSNAAAVEVILAAIEKAGYKRGPRLFPRTSTQPPARSTVTASITSNAKGER